MNGRRVLLTVLVLGVFALAETASADTPQREVTPADQVLVLEGFAISP